MPGRSGSQKRQRTYILQVPLNAREQRRLEKMVEATGHSRAGLARSGLFKTPLPPRPVPKPRVEHKMAAKILAALGQVLTELRQLNNHLAKIGTNINQLTRYAHLDRYQHHSIEAALADFRAMKGPVEKVIGLFHPIRAACLKALGIRS